MDVLWDDDDNVGEGTGVNGDAADTQVESVFGGQDSRVTKWRRWSRNWKRKWHQLRHARGTGAGALWSGTNKNRDCGGDEGESLLVSVPKPKTVEVKPEAEDPLDQLPNHLADAIRR